jgi:hypothetical protein
MGTIGDLLDTNHDRKIEAPKLRQAVNTGVQSLFLVADSNQSTRFNGCAFPTPVTRSRNRPSRGHAARTPRPRADL